MQPADFNQILIVEDDARLRSILARGLRGHGYAVHTAGSVQATLALLARESPDAAIVDIDLPDGTGWDVVRAIRRGRHPEIRTIVISATSPLQAPDSDAAPDLILRKPFGIDLLLARIQPVQPGSEAHLQQNERSAE